MYGTLVNGPPCANRDVLHLMETFPEHFNRIVWGPHDGNAGTADFQVAASKGSTVGTQVGNHVCNGNFGKSKSVIVEFH